MSNYKLKILEMLTAKVNKLPLTIMRKNRYYARFPWPERKIEEEVKLMREISEEDRSTVRQSWS